MKTQMKHRDPKLWKKVLFGIHSAGALKAWETRRDWAINGRPEGSPVCDMIKKLGGFNRENADRGGWTGDIIAVGAKKFLRRVGGRKVCMISEALFEREMIGEHSENAMWDAISRELQAVV
jgi:hypothetical protein